MKVKSNPAITEQFSIYIHFPFCIKKCNYCDFVSYKFASHDTEQYVHCLTREIELFAEKNFVKGVKIVSIFFGGGTPSLISVKQLTRVFETLNSVFNLSSVKEITLEANPETVNKAKFSEFKKLGINRISMGAQSFNDKTLKILGRVHDSKKIYEAYSILRKVGFFNVNLDLMFSLPEESIEDAISSLKKAIALRPEHISYYSLTIEKGTNFYRNRHNLNLPNQKEEYLQFSKGIKLLESEGYGRYEISNFALNGFESVHNIHYWKNLPYFGFGVSAASFLKRKRSQNYFRIPSYCDAVLKQTIPKRSTERLTGLHAKAEHMILGLRMIKGVNKNLYYYRFGTLPDYDFSEKIEFFKKRHLLKENTKYIALTKKGSFIANGIFKEFLP